jgi:DNA-binding PadR family transcriptional regulator
MGRRFFRYGELPLVLLALLDHRPMSGYELMAELGRLFAPSYRPSPGSVYPALKSLESERLVRSSQEGAAVFVPTATGRRVLDERGRELTEFELRTGRSVRSRPAFDAVLDQFVVRLAELAGHVAPEVLQRHLDETLERLRRVTAGGGAPEPIDSREGEEQFDG